MRTENARAQRAASGFTLIEIVVVLLLVLSLTLYGAPKLLSVLQRAKVEGTARQAANLMRATRMEAIKRNCFGVVGIDPAARQVIAFADLDRDGVFEPEATPADRLIGRLDLPNLVDFKDAEGDTGLDSVKGFVNPDVPIELPDQQVMFQPDGSVIDAGALRFADRRGNYLEVNVAPRTTGRVELRKHEGGDADAYYANGDGGKTWNFEQD